MKVKTKKTGLINRKTKGYRIDTTVAEAAAIATGAIVCAGYTVIGFGKGVVRFIKNKPNNTTYIKFPDVDKFVNSFVGEDEAIDI